MEHLSFSTRKASADDIEKICELWKEAVVLAGKYEPVFRPSDTGALHFVNFVAECIANDLNIVLVAEYNDLVVGYCMMTIEQYDDYYCACRYGYIVDLSVTLNFRRKGIGSLLLEKAKQLCLENDISRIEVSVSTKNPLSSAFWRRKGFDTYFETKYLSI